MDPRDRPKRDHARPDEQDLRDDAIPAAADRRFHRPLYAGVTRGKWLLPLAVPILSLILIALILSGCEIGLALGLPNNDACRDVETSPGAPISNECLDTIGRSPTNP